jgi:hypothetical protein
LNEFDGPDMPGQFTTGECLMMKDSHPDISHCLTGEQSVCLLCEAIIPMVTSSLDKIAHCSHRNAEVADAKGCSDGHEPPVSREKKRIDPKRQWVTPRWYLPNVAAWLARCFDIGGDRLSIRKKLRNDPHKVFYSILSLRLSSLSMRI